MSSSSNLLPLPLSLISLLLCIHCNGGTDLTVSRCEQVESTQQPDLAYADKTISHLLNLAPMTNFAYSYESNVYGMGWCRGDLSSEKCSACLAGAAIILFDRCSHQVAEARIVFLDFCYLRLGTRDFLTTLDVEFGRELHDNSTSRKIEGKHRVAYWELVKGLLKQVIKVAIMNVKKKKFATRQVRFGEEKMKIYGMGECVHGISAKECYACLVKTFGFMMLRCKSSTTCEGFLGSCFLQYLTLGS